MGTVIMGTAGHGLHGLHGREYRQTLKVMIHQHFWGVKHYWNADRLVYWGKMSHRRTVFVSISTGVPEALVAQCRVKPLQTSSPVSPWVMT